MQWFWHQAIPAHSWDNRAQGRIYNKRWLWCWLPTHSVASCLGLYIPIDGFSKGSLRRACLVGLFREDECFWSPLSSGETQRTCQWELIGSTELRRTHTALVGLQPLQLNRQGLVTQGRTDRTWRLSEEGLTVLTAGDKETSACFPSMCEGLEGDTVPLNRQQHPPGDASPGGQCYSGIQQFATSCCSLRLTEIMGMLSALLITTFSPFFRNRPSCKV